MFCEVIVTRPFNQTFTYKLRKDQNVKEGSIVCVPFGKQNNQIGMVTKVSDFKSQDKNFLIKEVETVFEKIILSKKIIKFIYWISDYTLSPIGLVLKLFLINHKIISTQKLEYKNNVMNFNYVKLNNDQKKATNSIKNLFSLSSAPIVLEGVTGSGKTEVYFDIVKDVIKKNKQVLIMVPEISLTPQLEERFFNRFSFLPEVWHSKISDKKRSIIWHQCYEGKPIIVVGARSSLFLPFSNLGLIIVDEEHDTTYKQEDTIRYHARDLATVRSKIEKAGIILTSATPSLETQNNINKKKYSHVFLPTQFSGLELPPIQLIDLNLNKLENNKWISDKIFTELNKSLNNNEQALLFLNRRGYSPLSLCTKCGYRYQCNHCSSWLVMHQEKKRLLCHQCGAIYPITPSCPNCSEKESTKLVGPGVERLAEEAISLFPNKKIEIMSSDSANTPKKIKEIIHKFENKKIDILVATQIMSKGYHFPNLSFVGVIDADVGLVGGDLRAIEKTFNLLQQVSGRAGRSKKIGRVFIQTYFPNQQVIQSLQKRDRKNFVLESLKDREKFRIPPFSYLTSIIISGSTKHKTEMYGHKLASGITFPSNMTILGPVEAPIFLLRGKYRYRLLIKGKSRKILNKYTKLLLQKTPAPSSIKVSIDVDPYSFA